MEEKLKRLVNIYDKYYDDPYKICIKNNINIEDYDIDLIPLIIIRYIRVRFKSLKNNKEFSIIYMPYKNYVDEKIFLENNEKVIFSYRKSNNLTHRILTVWDRLLCNPSHKNI